MPTASRELYGPHWHRDKSLLEIPDRQYFVHLETGYGLFCAAIRDSVLDEIERMKAHAARQGFSLHVRLETPESLSSVYGCMRIKTKTTPILPRQIHQKICRSRWNALSKADRNWWIKTAQIGPIFYSNVQARMARGPSWALVRKFVQTRRIAFYWSELRAEKMKPGGELYKADHAAFESEMGK